MAGLGFSPPSQQVRDSLKTKLPQPMDKTIVLTDKTPAKPWSGVTVDAAPWPPSSTPGATPSNEWFTPENIGQSLTTLKFGQAPTPVTAPTIGQAAQATAGKAGAASVAAPPKITAPQVTAQQGGFADFNNLQKAIFESTYRPIEQEINRQRGIADDRLASQLAAAGIADSGAGVDIRRRQDDEFKNQLVNSMTNASNQAATQRYGMEYAQSMDNARMRQEANFANANLSMQAQSENARNLLTANITSAQLATQASIASAQFATQASIANAQAANQTSIANAQLQMQALGINAQQEQNARQNYLQLLGIQQQDLARQDAFELENLSLFYNTYLKQFAIVTQAGTASFGKGDTSGSGTGFNVQI